MKQTHTAASIMQSIHRADIYASFTPLFPEDMQGWNSRFGDFDTIIATRRPSVVIDVGVWKGASTIYLASLMRKHGLDGAVIAVDTFRGSWEHWGRTEGVASLVPCRHGEPLLYEQFLSNVVHLGAQDYIVPFPQTSEGAAELLCKLGIRAGLVHIDAAHDTESVLRDARAYWKILEPGGYLIGDDYHETWPTVMKGADQFGEEVGLPLVVKLPKWIIQKPLNLIASEPSAVGRALAAGDLGAASASASARGRANIEFKYSAPSPPHRVAIDIQGPTHAVIEIAKESTVRNYSMRKAAIADLIAVYLRGKPPVLGKIEASAGDGGIEGADLAPCDYRPESILIPDWDFILSNGYEGIRTTFAKQATPWATREPVAFWRGSTTGERMAGWSSTQRVHLCEIARAHPSLIDAGFTQIVQMTQQDWVEFQDTFSLLPRVEPTAFDQYRLQIDVDGNSNAWGGLFIKLLSGSPVLKIASRRGWRQWYYDRLIPWGNYVPVDPDMFDLTDKIKWLLLHDDIAQSIGANGKALANSMTYEAEMRAAALRIGAALSRRSALAGI